MIFKTVVLKIFLLFFVVQIGYAQDICGYPYATDFRVGLEPQDFCSGDFDNDGDMDVATADFGSQSVTVLFNDGEGNYFNRLTIEMTGGVYDLVAADFDGDSNLDIAVLKTNPVANISVLFNRGGGIFDEGNSFLLPEDGSLVIAGDWNGDGHQDLSVLLQGPTTPVSDCSIHQYLNTGTGDFIASRQFSSGSCDPSTFKAADLDGDQDLDLVVAHVVTDKVSILFNSGNGEYSLPVDYAVGEVPRNFDIGDVDGDNDLDLAICNFASDTIYILLNDGNGGFSYGQTIDVITVEPLEIVFGQLDSNSSIDFAVITKPVEFTGGTEVNLYLNDGSGHFEFSRTIESPSGPDRLLLADVNSDSQNDVLILYSTTFSVERGGIYSLLNRGEANFSTPATVIGKELKSVGVIDFDNDGDDDLVATDTGTNQVIFLANQGDNQWKSDYLDTSHRPEAIEFGDLNNDGQIDVAVRTAVNASIFLNDNNERYLPRINVSAGPSLRSIAFADVNNDGNQDLIFGTRNDGFGIRFNLGEMVFGESVQYDFHQSGEQIIDIAPVDINRDGFLDVVLAKTESEIEIWHNDGIGGFEFAENIPTLGPSLRVSVDDIDLDGRLDLLVGSNLTFYKGIGDSFELTVDNRLPSVSSVVLSDINGDGFKDAVTSSSVYDSASVHLNDGAGGFETVGTWRAGRTPSGVGVGDFDGNLRPDIVAVSAVNGSFVRLQSPCDVILGDVNLDGEVSLFDVAPFAELLNEGRYLVEADINQDNEVDLLDVAPFVNLLNAG